MPHPEDFVYEFFQILELKITEWINSLGTNTYLGDTDFRKPLENFANFAHFAKRDEYCRLRSQGLSPQSAISSLVNLPKPDKRGGGTSNSIPSETIASKWKDLLKSLKSQPIYYAHIPRMIEYLLPFVSKDKRNTILITESSISPELFKLPDNVSLVKFVDSGCRLFCNDFLEKNFPIFFSFANTVALLDQCIEPEEFACICGCNITAQIWSTICASRGAKSICYQHGWPAFIHAAFRNMPFDNMVTWGLDFERLWLPYNPSMKFITGRYPYPINNGSHDRITFFLQEPFFIATKWTQEQMIGLIAMCATKYPDKIIQYRAHPESSIDDAAKKLLSDKPNIVDATILPIADVYASTRVAVAHYSSTIMECVAHGCCPLVFNPSPSWNYNPDLGKLGLGFISTDYPSFFKLLPEALNHQVSYDVRKQWFG